MPLHDTIAHHVTDRSHDQCRRGYVLAIATQLLVFPLFGIEASLQEHLMIGFAFVAVSLARGYLLRRVFEAIRA